MPDRLTADELSELVGCKPNQRVRMAEWLRTHSWIHDIDMNGLPIVMRAYRDRKLGITEGKASATYADSPNYGCFSR